MSRQDDLIRYAFGELTEAEAERLRAELRTKPEALREAEDLQALRQDLRRLNEIPECQLSVERLRDAVFQSNLRERARPVWLQWLPLAGVGAAAMLGVVAWLNSVEPSEQPLPIRDSVAELTPPAANSMVASSGSEAFDILDFEQLQPRQSVVEAAERDATPPLSAPARYQPPIQAAPAVHSVQSEEPVTITRPSPAPVAEAAVPVADEVPEEQPIVVVIEPESNNALGARNAAELTFGTDVVIGG